jgi:VIT1/CCC1 family predicted Fe2+/Mn2+ transporter
MTYPRTWGFQRRRCSRRIKREDERTQTKQNEERIMLYSIIAVLLVLWLLGFTMHVGGGLIHALLLIAIVVFVFNLVSGRRSVV